ncbi:hypothetical protein [Kitasatospora herbaricolor]|uniref:Uncharacterized protein n=1 Tax=Kitasatospora herbaricolor TaxID=68217 RepID=A0ABZ1W064_9ACTN|nr:hypothetical protein [Kitasatospora herbaricolor]
MAAEGGDLAGTGHPLDVAGALPEHRVDAGADLADVAVVGVRGRLDAFGLGDVVVLAGRVLVHVVLRVTKLTDHLALGLGHRLLGPTQRLGHRDPGVQGGDRVRLVGAGVLAQVGLEAVGGGAGHVGHRPVGARHDGADRRFGGGVPGFPGGCQLGQQLLVGVGEHDAGAVLVALDDLQHLGEVGRQLDHDESLSSAGRLAWDG